MTTLIQNYLQTSDPELERLANRINQLIDLVISQASKLNELQNELTYLKQEHEILSAEHEHLNRKIYSAQSHIHTMLEQLPADN